MEESPPSWYQLQVTRSEIAGRRLKSISIVFVSFGIVTLILPILMLLALVYDLAAFVMKRRHFMATRLVLIGWIYLGTECLGIAALGVLWIASAGGRFRRIFIDGTYSIQRWWAGSLFRTIRRAFDLRFEVEGSETIAPGPVLVFMRHASIVDNLLPSAFVTAPHRIKLRYVLKQELLSDPALDIAGSRLPNYFVDRGSTDSAREVAEVGRLGEGMGVDEGVLIYPEGTRFTTERRSKILERLKTSNPELYARAVQLEFVLPPRLSGPLALLDARPFADVVIAAHAGLDGFSHIRDILGGGLVGSTIHLRFQRFPHSDIPTEESQRVEWLLDRWSELNDWIRNR